MSESKSGLVLGGHNITIDALVAASQNLTLPVDIAPASLKVVEDSFALLIKAAEQLTTGVGQNKDVKIFEAKGSDGPKLTKEAENLSKIFNRNAMFAHSAGVANELLSREKVRGIMIARLNALLHGHAAPTKETVLMYQQFLNRRIYPCIPARASVGQADICVLSHIGLAFIGEGQVHVADEKEPRNAAEAMKALGIAPLVPWGKDMLAIISSNAFTATKAAFALAKARHLLRVGEVVFALSLEALNGNLAPYLAPVHGIRPFAGVKESAARILNYTRNSYLHSSALQTQDPLSYRCAAFGFGSAFAALERAWAELETQLNHSDDNPSCVLNVEAPKDRTGLVERDLRPIPERYLVETKTEPSTTTGFGAVFPTANFSPLPWALGVENLQLALAHISQEAALRMTKLANPDFTHLPRFLSPDPKYLVFSAIQKPFMALNAENRALCNPVSLDSFPMAGDIEDVSTNVDLAVDRLDKMLDNLSYIIGIELMHACQAVDLRSQIERKTALDEKKIASAREDELYIPLGVSTSRLYKEFRAKNKFFDQDRALTPEIQAAHHFVMHEYRPDTSS